MSDNEREEIVRAWMNGTTLPELAHTFKVPETEVMQAIIREANSRKRCRECDE